MSEMWKPQPLHVYKDWVDTIINESTDKLNSWELSFVSSIENQIINGRNLTESQANKLEIIYAEKTK